VTKDDQPSSTSTSTDQIEPKTSSIASVASQDGFKLRRSDREIILDMINWTLMDIEGSDFESEDDAREMEQLASEIRDLASRMGFKQEEGGRMA